MPLLEIVRTDRTSKQVGTRSGRDARVAGQAKWAGTALLSTRHVWHAAFGLPGSSLYDAHTLPARTPARCSTVQVILDTLEFSSRIKKTPVVVGNCTGFAVNRVFFPYTQARRRALPLCLQRRSCRAAPRHAKPCRRRGAE